MDGWFKRGWLGRFEEGERVEEIKIQMKYHFELHTQ